MKLKIEKAVRIFDIIFALFCAIVFVFIILGEYMLPSNVITYDNSNQITSIYSFGDDVGVESVDARTNVKSSKTINFLGVVPVKSVAVTTKTPQRVLVSGDAFGIKLFTNGVIVVGTQAIDSDEGSINPAKQAGIELGDIVVSINKVKVYTAQDVIDALNDNNGRAYSIVVKRNDVYKTFVLEPVYSSREGKYKAGMWVRDSTAGIGTITFFNPYNNTFAALGHQINDVDTKEIMPMLEGVAVDANVTSVQRAKSGTTGSLVCEFSNDNIGSLVENTDCGVYGRYDKCDKGLKSYLVASPQEINRGDAKMISTVDGEAKEYDIEITHINHNSKGDKDIIFRIKDSDLINKTGGIVQGMSGSPIVQNDKLVGAVTHVIINNPKKGYAIFAQTMLEQSNSIG